MSLAPPRRRRRGGAALGVVAWLVAGIGPAGAQAPAEPSPDYRRTVDDAVTADNPPAAPGSPGCVAPGPCVLPDPNPDDPALQVDSFTSDRYERPVAADGAVVGAIDLVSASVGSDAERHYYRMDLFATDGDRGLPYAYGFELDYDDGDSAGDLMVTVDGARLGTTFAPTGVVALWNRASTISGPTPGLPDEPGATPPGFELRAFDRGANLLDGAPGGADAVVARVAPDRPASIEVAVRRSFLVAVNEGDPVSKVSFRPDASLARLPMAAYAVHDRLRRSESGSPFPFLAGTGAPEACPTTERGLSPAARIALDSGTTADTGRPNPCHPAKGVSAYDNMPFVAFDPRAPGALEGDPAPDLAVSATHAGDLVTGERARLVIGVRNVGTAPTTGAITVTDRLPAGLRPVAAEGRRWACSVAGRTVSCTTRDALAAGRSASVVVLAVVDARGGEVRNHADVVTPGDPQPANNVAADVARVVSAGSSPAVPAALGGGVAAAAGLAVLGVRRRRGGRISRPGTPAPSP